MMDYIEHLRQHRRLIILRALAGAPGYSANESLLLQVAHSFGDKATRDQLRNELAWLDEQGLVKAKLIADIYVAEITKRGEEVSQGIAVVPGVHKPAPGN